MIAAITGANGFIGRHLTRRFTEAGWVVRPLVRADWRNGTIARELDGVDVVVHAAGATRAPTVAALRQSNVALTERVTRLASDAGVGRLVFISSQAAAGPAPRLDAPVTEATVAEPVEAYGRSKLDAEQLVRSGSRAPFVIVRPAAVYGPGDRDFLAVHRLAQRGIAIHPGTRDQWISVVHVDDVASGILAASTADRAVGETFFFANEQPVQWRNIFRTVAGCAGRSLTVDLAVPRGLVAVGAVAGDVFARLTGRTPLLTSGKLALSTPPFWVCASDHARATIGFSTPTALQDGLCATYHWYRANGWL